MEAILNILETRSQAELEKKNSRIAITIFLKGLIHLCKLSVDIGLPAPFCLVTYWYESFDKLSYSCLLKYKDKRMSIETLLCH